MLSAAQWNAITHAQLAPANLLLVAALWLALSTAMLRDRRRRWFTDAAQRVHRCLFVGLTCWLLEVPCSAWSAEAFFVCNAGVALAFFRAGSVLLGMQGRMHHLMQPAREDLRAWAPLQRALAHRAALPLALGAALIGIAASCYLAALAGDVPPADRIAAGDGVASLLSCAGMVVLGLGFWREFTREKPELVSIACAASIVLYGVLQLARFAPALLVPMLALALLLKLSFLLSMASFWTLVHEMARAQAQEQERFERSARDANRRTQIARELHDTVLNDLQGMRHWNGIAEQQLRADPEAAAHALRELDTALGRCAGAVRNIVEELPLNRLVEGGLRHALEALSRSLRQRSRLETSVSWSVDGTLAPAVEEALAAIAFEACHNVERHAKAARLWIACVSEEDRITLTIEDDGGGLELEATARASHGLANMRARALELGGELRLERRDGGGTRIAAELGA